MKALAELYGLLSEEDAHFATIKELFHSEETQIGVSLQQFGFYPIAQNVYFDSLSKAQQLTTSSPIGAEEFSMWEQEWINCAKKLNQWESKNRICHTLGDRLD